MPAPETLKWGNFAPFADMRFTASDWCETVDGGQAFSWRATQNAGEFKGVFANVAAKIRLGENGVPEAAFALNLDAAQCAQKLADYFDARTDYAKIRLDLEALSDEKMQKALRAYPTLRILRQNVDETIVGFICSSSKRIPQIKKCVQNLSEKFGEKICCGFFALPTIERLADADPAEIRKCGLGFRADYLSKTARKIAADKFDTAALREMPYAEAKNYLTSLSGIGDKIADCILLFGCARFEAFPVDTWIRKAVCELYPVENDPKKIRTFAAQKFPNNAGFAQQMLFAAKRNGRL